MPSKFGVYLSLNQAERAMFDEMRAAGITLKEQLVVSDLLAALKGYWDQFKVYPMPIRVVCDVPAEQLLAVAEAKAIYDAKLLVDNITAPKKAAISPISPTAQIEADVAEGKSGKQGKKRRKKPRA